MSNWKLDVGSLKFIVLVVFTLALLPRLLSLDAFITWDEPMWTYRSIKFLAALRRADFAGTFLVGHPGVMTMWCGATGISIQRLLGYGSAADLAWLSGLPTLDPRDTEALRKLASFLPAAKLPAALLHAACIVGIYLLARRLFGIKTSLLAALLLTLNPFHLALSRVLHIDALAANFMTLSLLSLLVHLRQSERRRSPDRGARGSVRRPSPIASQCQYEQPQNRSKGTAKSPPLAWIWRSRLSRNTSIYLFLSGAFAALATLSKSYALFLGPFIGLLLAATYLTKATDFRRAIPSLLASFALWCLAAALVFFAAWPAMWVNPLGTLQGLLGTALGYAVTPVDTSEFFLGKHVAYPGPWFYPVVLAFRTTPLTLIGLGAAILLLCVKRKNVKRELRGDLVGLLAYGVLFAILITPSAKKFDRYMLPVILALDIVAAWGLSEVWSLECRVSRLKFGFWALLLLQGGHVLSYHPYYLAYYNPLFGGTAVAVRVLPMGWGEGMDLTAEYLNQKENAASLRVATGGIPGFAPLFKGQTEDLTEHNMATADYTVLYVSDVQQDSPAAAALHDQQPEHVVSIHGVDYVWIYPNTHYLELIAYLESRAQPGDVILLDAPSPFARHYRGSLACYAVSDSQSWTELTRRLAESASPRRLWYIAYPDSNMGAWISYQLNKHARLIDRETLSLATVSQYLLPSPLALEASPIQVQANVNFGNRLRLTGYGFAGDTLAYRKPLAVILSWETIAEMQKGFALSLRLVDDRGILWAQADEWLENDDSLPTYAWRTGEVTEGYHALVCPPGTPPGTYELKLILYGVNTLQALDVLDEKGTPLGTAYSLGRVSVVSPGVPPTIEELAIPHRLHYDFDGQVELLGYGLSSTEVRAGEAVRVTLFWRAVRPMEDDYHLHLVVQDDQGNIWAQGEYPLANEEYPTSRWKAGEVIRGQYDLAIDAAAPTGEHTLNFRLQTSNLQPLATLSVVAPERLFTVPTEIQYPLRANLADKVALLGYDLDRTSVRPGGTLRLTLYWQALTRMETSYTVFAHLIDDQNRIWGQKDNPPVKGTYPTTGWLPGEVVIDEYEIAVDATAPAGEYQIEVGMYDLKTMQRLPVLNERGSRLPHDRILLSKVRVE